MSRRLKIFSFWLRRKSHLAVIIIGAVVVGVLFLNEDASWEHNMKYQEEIKALKVQVKLNLDSAGYYRARREMLLTDPDELEQIAREEYHMQKPTEDVYVVKHLN